MSKGSEWERKIAKDLTMWLTGQSKEYYFWRSPGSGSIATISMTNPDLHGDIIPLKEEANILCFNFGIECKNGYKETSLDKHLKYNKSDDLKSFWLQVLNDSSKTNKYPMLIYKKKGFKTPWVGINKDVFEKLKKYVTKLRFVHLYWAEDIEDTYFFEYKEFFNTITPNIIREMNET